MKLKTTSDNLIELIALRLGVVPTPLMDTSISMCLSRFIIIAVKLNIFECLKFKPLTANEVTGICKTDAQATQKLLDVLVACGYLGLRKEQYFLKKVASKWLLEGSAHSIRDLILFLIHQWDLITNYFEDYIKTGRSVNLHQSLSNNDWELYQKGMRALSNMYAKVFVKRMPIPTNAKKMLDIGGAHGYLSVSLCRHYKGLTSQVLDLPEAVKVSAPILAKEKMGNTVTHIQGDALKYDFGNNEWDIILMSQFVHHFDEKTNQDLCNRVAKALKPGGILIIQEIVRPLHLKKAGMAGTMMDLFFAFTSQSGTWSFKEIANWQKNAGLVTQKPILFREAPGLGAQVAKKK